MNEDNVPSYFKYWGKTSKEGSFHLLPYHCLDVAAVGKIQLDNNPFLVESFKNISGIEKKELKNIVIFFLALHDLGKFAESFQQLVPILRNRLWPGDKILKTNYSVRHDNLGYVLWNNKGGLEQHFQTKGFGLASGYKPAGKSVFRNVLKPWVQTVTGHHGQPPKSRVGTSKIRIKDHFRAHDVESAISFVTECFIFFNPDFDSMLRECQSECPRKNYKHASWLMAGFSVLCDWLGSDREIFHPCSQRMPLDQYWTDHAIPGARQAVFQSGILPAETAPEKKFDGLFPKIKHRTPLQMKCCELPMAGTPQLLILEDVTGAGKTEAAIMLAHRLLAGGQGQGIYLGLPTMATANAMYERMVESYRCLYREGSRPSMVLSHGARHLSEIFQKSFLMAQPSDKADNEKKDETTSAECNRWLADHRKKALLADLGVGTIDQALLGVLPARHQSLRLFGLANKVLILDEVHAYDAYTGELLNRLIEFQAGLGGSVILLSATLAKAQRQKLIDAFLQPLTGAPQVIEKEAYPLLTHTMAGHLSEMPIQTRPAVERRVHARFLHSEDQVVEKIREAVEKGQCVCWIRNTVTDARDAWQLISDCKWMADDRLHLFHSRYALHDRLSIEKEVMRLFGSGSTHPIRQSRVLVATQVVEQSLDLDFDVLVSDLAPIDLLIQRAGRLKRHLRNAQGDPLPFDSADQRSAPILYVLSPQITDEPADDWYKSIFPKACYVYPHTGILWLTSQILNRNQGWKMPDDARELIEYVYGGEEEIPVALQALSGEAEGEEIGKSDMARFNALKWKKGYAQGEKWHDDAVFPTRTGEETHTAYLARWESNRLLPWVAHGDYPWDLSSLNVSKEKMNRLSSDKAPGLSEALVRLLEQTERFNEFSFILPLSLSADGQWQATVEDINSKEIKVAYCGKKGLIS
ncbi:MAG: CRISPR-associated helicase Cas3' [Desulfobacterales bacterium]|nr:CRISPR-associated helicase Cas3' [Desulfobacterales bacterium]